MPKCCRNRICTAGELKHLILIQSKTVTQDDLGEEVETWATFHTAKARINPTQGGKTEDGNQVQSETSHKIMIRHKAGITPSMRVKFGSRIFDINFARNIFEDSFWLELNCKEDVN